MKTRKTIENNKHRTFASACKLCNISLKISLQMLKKSNISDDVITKDVLQYMYDITM